MNAYPIPRLGPRIRLARLVCAAPPMLATALCPAQTLSGGWEISVSNVVSPSNPTATIEVRAWFAIVPGVAEVFAGGDFDLDASEGLLSLAQLHLFGPNQSVGVITGSHAIDVQVHQLHLPPTYYGSPSNPILTWSASWTTTSFAPRMVDVLTRNSSAFWVYDAFPGNATPVPLANVTHGQAVIQVIPAPASVVLLLPLPLMGRRRR